MNNPWYDRINGGRQMTNPQTGYGQPGAPQIPGYNPAMLAGALANAMRNPQAFAMQAFSDVPREMWSDPARALQYIQQTRGLSQADIQGMIGNLLPR